MSLGLVLFYVIKMVKRSKGTLSSMTRKLKGSSKVTVAEQVRTFNIGDNVIIAPRANTRGMPALRYKGRRARVIDKRGKCYLVEIKDGKKKKELVAGPIHLKLAA